VITKLEIDGLRGVKRGTIDGLSPLTVLVGSNGSGKSTVLDAILIGAAHAPGDAVGRAVQRREELLRGSRWLFWRAGGTAKLGVVADGTPRSSTLGMTKVVLPSLQTELSGKQLPPPFTEVTCDIVLGPHQFWSRTAFAANNAYAFTQGPGTRSAAREARPSIARETLRKQRDAREAFRHLPEVRFVEPRPGARHGSFHNLYTQVVQTGQSDAALSVARAVLAGLVRIEILTPDDVPVVFLVFPDYAIPLAASGDGVQSLLRLAFELATGPHALILLEEPEVHQHPAAIVESAKVILAAVRHGAQVVVSTHSLELIDGLVANAQGTDLEAFCVMRLKLDESGELRSVRVAGPDVAIERGNLDSDLR
jgi:predicted ATPase